jgi:hypothetical protein
LGDCFLWVVLENYCSSPIFWATLLLGKRYVSILIKNGLGYIFGDFLQTHLVTLIPGLTILCTPLCLAQFFTFVIRYAKIVLARSWQETILLGAICHAVENRNKI